MNGTVLQDFLLLFIDLGIGIVIGFLFDCYRVLRRLLRPGWLVTQVADFSFWVCCAVLAFQVFFEVTGGKVGLYSFLIIPAGTVLYLKLASPGLQWVLLIVFIRIGKLLIGIFKVLRYVVWLLIQVVVLPFRWLWWLIRTCLQVVVVLLRLLWLPEKLLLQWFWRGLREGWRSFCRWLRQLPHRIFQRK